jgi:hypothetical protein
VFDISSSSTLSVISSSFNNVRAQDLLGVSGTSYGGMFNPCTSPFPLLLHCVHLILMGVLVVIRGHKGVVYCYSSTLILKATTVTSTVGISGGGIVFAFGCTLQMTGLTATSGTALGAGGAIAAYDSKGYITASTFVGCQALYGYVILCCCSMFDMPTIPFSTMSICLCYSGALALVDSPLTVTGSIFISNYAVFAG